MLCACLVAAGCGVPFESDVDLPVQFEKPFNSIAITNTKSLLLGYHEAFDSPAQGQCVKVLGGAKPSIDDAGEAFDLEYKESKQELRSFFNLTAQAQANLLLIHAKGTVELSKTLNQDDVALFFGLHAYQYYSTSYDAKSLALNDDTVKRLENKAGNKLDDVAKEQLFKCGAGYLRKLMVGGELDVVLELTASDYVKTAQLKKSLEVSGIAGNAKWYSDSKITDQLGGVTAKVKVYAAGFAFQGAAVTNALAQTYIQGQIDKAAKGSQNAVIAAVTAMQTVHAALKKSVTADQNSDQSCTKVMVFQGVLGDYFTLGNVPEKCGPDAMFALQKRVFDLADRMATQSLAFETAEQACARAVDEIDTYYSFIASGLPKGALNTGFGFEPTFHQNTTYETWLSYPDTVSWLAPYFGNWTDTGTGEFELKANGVRSAALDYYRQTRLLLSAPAAMVSVIDDATEDPKTIKEWQMLVQDPTTFKDKSWNKRQYSWKQDTWLRNLYTYVNKDRVRPIYIVQNKKDVKGADIKNANVTCAAGGRFFTPAERFALAGYIAMPANVPEQDRVKFVWMDPAVRPSRGPACTDKNTPAVVQHWYLDPPNRKNGPLWSCGITWIACQPIDGKFAVTTNMLCVPTDQGVFGGTNPFAI